MKRVLFLLVAILFVVRRPARVGAAERHRRPARRDCEATDPDCAAAEAHRGAEKQPPAAWPRACRISRKTSRRRKTPINSLRETINSKVNLNGYYNFRFFADGSEEPLAFQQHHLGVLMAKQLGKFNFLMELELQNVPHHPEIAEEGGEEWRRHAG